MMILASILTSCGYRLAGDKEPVAPDLQSVFVEAFTNKTGEAYTENIFRSAFIGRFSQEGRFMLAHGRNDADLICRGIIRGFQVTPLAYRANNLAAEERITVTLEIVFEERVSGRQVWSDRRLVGAGDYRVASAASAEAGRRNALVKLANDSAERAYRLMMSGF